MGRAIRAVLIVMVVGGFAAGVCGGIVYILWGDQLIDLAQTTLIRLSLNSRQAELSQPVGNDSSPIRFSISPGDTPRTIGANLVTSNLIFDAELFVDYVRVNNYDTQLEAGTYFLNQTQTIPQIALALTDSSSSQFPFRILEGWRLEEIAAAIDDNPYFGFSGTEFLSIVGTGAAVEPEFASYVGLPPDASLEGFLFPDTYQLPAEVTAVMLRDMLTQSFRERVGMQIPQDAAAQGLTLYEVVTIAAIVQREAIHAEEHPLIASVYRNRLNIDMKLDADPTVQYAIGFKDGRWWPQITRADYTGVVSPYNTYLNIGLPPGPIASPGLSAIRAATYPAESSYFYFRADCSPDNFHTFATTYEEHLSNGC